MIVLDASLVMAWLVAEQLPAADADVYETLPANLILVPSHWPLEIGNALRSRMRTGQLSFGNFRAIMDRLDLLNIQMQDPIAVDGIGPLAQFAVTHNLTTYDAAYVQLALQRAVPLATLDRAMRSAAVTLNIPLLPAIL